MNWVDAIKRVNEIQPTSPAAISDRKNLKEVFRTADKWGLQPDHVYKASISNLRRILPHARKAIKKRNVELLERLFFLAATLNTADLRLALGGIDRRIIPVEIITDLEKGDIYVAKFTKEEFHHIQRKLRLEYEFHVGQETAD